MYTVSVKGVKTKVQVEISNVKEVSAFEKSFTYVINGKTFDAILQNSSKETWSYTFNGTTYSNHKRLLEGLLN